ncbi:conserved exported protein of unknown function [Rhodovastum atsumiense]|uniref:Surface antigen domain-containing protein n=1 Tax=Rhodovastum atsumiense TaxID=504468 RepID=A0A5M6J282_9PROT|nr:hypothetical protein [Rhodovastum atsumiense]KAA5614726.1 hypothetical protein F1189_00935 [Rhodovastum atsumiense]CAH2599737.1 conserved exported protein of unknown function [Rhodovastum atsumiense]
MRLAGPAALLLLLAGCNTVADISALVGGGAAGAATANPAVGYIVGISTRAALGVGLKYGSRRWHRDEQDAIAQAAADLPEGGSGPWQVHQGIPFAGAHGEVRVVRAIMTPLAACREIVFAAAADPSTPPTWFSTTICRQEQGWKWALAEPAVPRWGALQ